MLSMKKIIPLMLLFFFISGTFATALNPISASELVENSWNTKMPMSQARHELGAVAVDGKIYAIGGHTEKGYTDITERYDPKTDSWITLEPMPTPRGRFAIATYEDKIYCIGGTTINEQGLLNACRLNEVYDTVTNSWCSKANAPFFGHAQANVVAGKIFITTTCEVFMYDPVADVWTNKTGVPANWELVFSFGLDNKIISISNFRNEHLQNEPQYEQKRLSYYTETDLWREDKTLPPPIAIHGVGVTTGLYAPKNVYVLGFKEWEYIHMIYDPVKDTWSSAAEAMPIGRSGYSVVVVDDLLYVIGGQSSIRDSFGFMPSSPLNEQYVPIGYDPLGYQTPFLPFLTNSVVVVTTILTACFVITTLFFYLRRKRNKRYESEMPVCIWRLASKSRFIL